MAVTRAVGMNLMENQENCSQLAAYCHISSAGMHASVRGVRFGKYVSLLRYRPTMATQVVTYFFMKILIISKHLVITTHCTNGI